MVGDVGHTGGLKKTAPGAEDAEPVSQYRWASLASKEGAQVIRHKAQVARHILAQNGSILGNFRLEDIYIPLFFFVNLQIITILHYFMQVDFFSDINPWLMPLHIYVSGTHTDGVNKQYS